MLNYDNLSDLSLFKKCWHHIKYIIQHLNKYCIPEYMIKKNNIYQKTLSFYITCTKYIILKLSKINAQI